MDLRDCPGGIHPVLAAWDDRVDHSDQVDAEVPEEDLTCAHPVELEVFDRASVGPVDLVATVPPCDLLDPDGWRIGE